MVIKWRMFLPTIAVLLVGCDEYDRNRRDRAAETDVNREVRPVDVRDDRELKDRELERSAQNELEGEKRAMRASFTDRDEPRRAVAVLAPIGNSRVSGTIEFIANNGAMQVKGHVTGLAPGKHGFHVHEFGDISSFEDGKSVGEHFNPTGAQHGAPGAEQRHLGDLGNIEANDRGEASIDLSDKKLKLWGPDSILGRSIVIHEGADDFTQSADNAGDPVAVGVIGVASRQGLLTGSNPERATGALGDEDPSRATDMSPAGDRSGPRPEDRP